VFFAAGITYLTGSSANAMELSVAAAWAPAANPDSLAASLAQIAGLFGAGMLTEAEFSAAKSTVLGLATPQPAVPAAEAPVLLATAVAGSSTAEPTMAAAVPVEEQAIATTEVHGVAPHGEKQKKRKRVESHDGADTDTDPDWVPGTAGRRKARIPCSGGTASQTRVSRFYGVGWHKPSRKWRVQLRHDGQNHYLGYFAEDKEEDAARAYDDAARNLRGGTNIWLLNFPTEAEVAAAEAATRPHGHGSRFLGVSWKESSRRWLVQLKHDGQRHYLGYFAEDKKEDAARAYDTAARKMRGTNAHGGLNNSGHCQWLNYPTPAEIASCARIAGKTLEVGMILQ
jgi:hypothetical protein